MLRKGRCWSYRQSALPLGRKQIGVVAIAANMEKASRAVVPGRRVVVKEFLYKESSLILGIHVCVKKFASVEGK